MSDALFSTTMKAKEGGAVPFYLRAVPEIDPFAANPAGEAKAGFDPLSPASIFLSGDAASPLAGGGRRLAALRRDLTAARGAEAAGKGDDARAAYLRALASLTAPLDEGVAPSPPLRQAIDGGDALYREALFGAAALAGSDDAIALLKHLNEFLRGKARIGFSSDPEALRAKLLKAFVIMRFNAGHVLQRQERYEAAERIVREVIDRTSFEEVAPELLLSANAIDLELAVRRYERAARHGDVQARRKLLPKILERATILLANQAGEPAEKREVAALYEAEVIEFLARMQLWNVAVERARRFTTNPAYASTAGARAVLDHPLLAPFVDEGRVLSSAEIRRRSPLFKAALAKIRAALAEAGAASLKETVIAGALGAVPWMIADAVADNRIDAVLAPAIAAAGVSVFNRLRHGWESDRASSAGMTGLFERTAEESAKDAGRLLLAGGLEFAAWLAPASIGAELPDAAAVALRTFANAAGIYARFLGWTAKGLASLEGLASHEGLLKALSSLSALSLRDAPELLYKGYLGLTVAQYAASIALPRFNGVLRKTAPLFIPGAIMLGAEIGTAVTGKSDYGDRIERGAIATAEILAMLLTSGVIALAQGKPPVQTLKGIGRGIAAADHNVFLSAAITVGLSSALGGMMQEGTKPDDIALVAVQAAAITAGLLPVTIGVSGVMKRNIEPLAGFREGWADAAGENVVRRFAEAAMGGLASFKTPYVFNRVGRTPTYDLLPAGLRSMIGWDTSLGFGLFSLTNFVAMNPTSTMTYPETGGTNWEREAFLRLLKQGDVEKITDHWIKAGQRIPFSHLLRPHRLADALFVFRAVERAFRPPVFPQMPQTHYFGQLHQLVSGGFNATLGDADLETMLSAVTSLANEALASGGSVGDEALQLVKQDVLSSVLTTLAAARGNGVHGPRISRFLDENNWMLDALALDEQEIPAVAGKSRRRLRDLVGKLVALDMQRYDEHVREHAARDKPSVLKESFGGVVHAQETPPPPWEVIRKEAEALIVLDGQNGNEGLPSPLPDGSLPNGKVPVAPVIPMPVR